MNSPFGRTKLTIVVSLALVACILYVAIDPASANRLAERNADDTLILLVELATEAGPDYIEAKVFFAKLLRAYSNQMERRGSLKTQLGARFSSEKNIAKDLKSIAVNLESAPETNTRTEIDLAKSSIAQFLTDSQLFRSKPIVPIQLDDIPPTVKDDIRKSLDEAIKIAQRYSSNESRTFDDAWAVCMANREAIIYLYLIRFWYEDIINEEELRKFRSEINRTIHYNTLLQETPDVKASQDQKDSHYELLDKYSASEIRRLRLLQAIIDKDFEQAQLLLQIALIEADVSLSPESS